MFNLLVSKVSYLEYLQGLIISLVSRISSGNLNLFSRNFRETCVFTLYSWLKKKKGKMKIENVKKRGKNVGSEHLHIKQFNPIELKKK